MKKLICLVVTLLMLSGCGLHEFQAGDPMLALEQTKESSKAACYQAMALQAPDYSKLSDMAVVVLEQQKAMVQMVGAVTGRSMDPCSGGTNLNDVLIADSNNRNQTARSIAGTVGNVVTVGAVAYGTYKTIDAVGENAGVKTYGDESAATQTVNKTSSSTKATNVGDGSATTSPAVDTTPLATDTTAPVVPGVDDIVPVTVTTE